jgi:hypothetical protein
MRVVMAVFERVVVTRRRTDNPERCLPRQMLSSRCYKGLDSRVCCERRATGSERQELRCRHDAVVVGATESTGIAYCYTNKRWLHVRVSD